MSKINKKTIIISLVVATAILLLLPICNAYKANLFGSAGRQAVDVSLVSLIGNPEEYDGKLVRVIGVGLIVFESNLLSLCKEHYEMGGIVSGINLDIDEKAMGLELDIELSDFNGMYVILEGTFKANRRSAEPGAIVDVYRYEPWEGIAY